MNIIVNKIIIDKNNELYYSAKGIEKVQGPIAEHFKQYMRKKYTETDKLQGISLAYWECVVLEEIARDMKFQVVKEAYSYKL